MVLALINHFGEFRPCTTVQMNTSFLKPLSARMRWCRPACCGRQVAGFGEIDIRGAGRQERLPASVTYALL